MTQPSNSVTEALATSGPDLDRLELAEDHCAVTGLQYGDEGKGQIVDLLASKFDLVVRYNGGANAGHTVTIGDQRFSLHLIPSGILYPHVVNVLANGVVIDPAMLIEEIEGWSTRGTLVGQNLRISDRAHLVFPYHKVEDGLLDRALGASRGDDAMIGTTGRGIGPCYADKAQRSTAIRMGDLRYPDRLQVKLDHVVKIKNVVLKALAGACAESFEPFDANQLTSQYLEFADVLKPHVCDTAALLYDCVQESKRLLFEGANATLLDVDHGTYPFGTSSSCSSLGIPQGTGLAGQMVKQVLGVVKAYTSRVGGGPFVTEIFEPIAGRIREIGREYGTTTGRPRRCGWLDLVAVRYAAKISGATDLVCTGLSVLAGFEQLKVCVGYQHDGQMLTRFPSDAAVLAEVKPIYEILDGFSDRIDHCRDFSKLPRAAQAYVQTMEQFIGVRVAIVCVGPGRDQILVR